MAQKKRILVVQHIEREGPERIADISEQLGLNLDLIEVYRMPAVPFAVPDDAILVVMGGPMNVSDQSDPRYWFLSREVDLLKRAIAVDAPVLGVCLGAQLLAYAAGASVYPNAQLDPDGKSTPILEVGWGKVTLHNRERERAFAGLGSEMTVLHWHGQTFDLPPHALHLASSYRCRHQAFRLGNRAYGLQFHVETTAETASCWARLDTRFVRAALGRNGVKRFLEETAQLAEQARPACDLLLRNILRLLAE